MSTKEKVKYCPQCGHIGDVESPARGCCPDQEPELVTPELAKQAKAGFKFLHTEPTSGS